MKMKTIATATVAEGFFLETTIEVSACANKFGVSYHVSIETANDIRCREFCNLGGENAFEAANEYAHGILAIAFQGDEQVAAYIDRCE